MGYRIFIIIAIIMSFASSYVTASDSDSIRGKSNPNTEKIFTFGYKYDVGKTIIYKDTVYRDSDMPLGNLKDKDFLICSVLPTADSVEAFYDAALSRDVEYGKDYFVSFKPEFIKKFIKDQIGDTIMVLWAGGRFLTRIVDIGRSWGYVCVLEPVSKLDDALGAGEYFIAFREGSYYFGPVFRCSQFTIEDSSYKELINILSAPLIRSWEIDRKGYAEDSCDVKLVAYQRDPFRENDTILVEASCRFALDDNHDLGAEYIAYKINNSWKFNTLYSPGIITNNSIISFAMDIDDDNTLEYLMWSHEGPAVMATIFEIRNGKRRTIISVNFPD